MKAKKREELEKAEQSVAEKNDDKKEKAKRSSAMSSKFSNKPGRKSGFGTLQAEEGTDEVVNQNGRLKANMGVTIYEQDKGLLQAQTAAKAQETARKVSHGQLEEDRESRE